MSENAGFTTMAGPKAGKEASEIGIGMLGYAFMGKAHTNAYKKIPYMMYPPPAIPRLIAGCGRSETAASEAARRYGYRAYYTDWRKMLEDDRLQLFDNGGPNDVHAEPCIAAAQARKHVICEKPLARTAEEAKGMLDAVKKAGVKHQVAFNYRFVPAIRQAHDLISSGKLGRIYHFRAVYLQEWIMPHYGTPMIWRLEKKVAGSGALGGLGAHIIDLARFLVGGVKSVSAMAKTFTTEWPTADGKGKGRVDVDDAFVAAVEFKNGAIGMLHGGISSLLVQLVASRPYHQVGAFFRARTHTLPGLHRETTRKWPRTRRPSRMVTGWRSSVTPSWNRPPVGNKWT